MSIVTGARLSRRPLPFLAGAASLAVLLAAGLLAVGLQHPVHAGGFEPVHAAGVAVPAASGYADLVSRVAPAIVTVRAERLAKPAVQGLDDGQLAPFLRQFGIGPRDLAPRREGGLGSGVIVSADGYVLTNNHVVEGAQKVEVELQDRRRLEARIVGTDPASDLAVLKLDARDLPVLPIGDSDAVRVGDVVLAFGNPLGVGQTVTMGIVSAKGRATGLGSGGFEDFIQTDAAINQGNSGGALVDASGRLVGINSQILSPTGGNIGIGFAIPARMAETVMTQLVHGGKVHRGQLGVSVQGVTSDLAKSLGLADVRGALVSDVVKGSPAERGGLERGDVILSLDGQPVSDANALRNRIASTQPGATVTLGFVRDGQQKTARVTLGELPSQKAAADDNTPGQGPRLGLTLQPVTPEMARELGAPGASGLYVAEVTPASPAADAGLQAGDVIEQVNRKPVRDVSGLRQAVAASGDKPALVLVRREGASLYLTLEAPRA